MIKTITKRFSFTMILVICALLGVFLGTGVAYAGNVLFNLSIGSSNYYGNHNEYNWRYDISYSYNTRQFVTMSSDKSYT